MSKQNQNDSRRKLLWVVILGKKISEEQLQTFSPSKQNEQVMLKEWQWDNTITHKGKDIKQ